MTIREAAKSTGEPVGIEPVRSKFKSRFYHVFAGKARQDYLSEPGFLISKKGA